MIKFTTEQFISKAKAKHGDKYDYSLVDYKGATTKVTIICPIHGEFLQQPFDHLNTKNGCYKCGTNIKTTKQFIEEAKKIHGDKYDYKETIYKGKLKLITIFCNKHKINVNTTPISHLKYSGGGCSKCVTDIYKFCSKKKKTTEQYIKEAENIHGDKYDYSKTVYINNKINLTIICKEHGEFLQKPIRHLHGRGCQICGFSKNTKTKDKFVEDARGIHGDKYDYSKVNYEHCNKDIIIICRKHGEFTEKPRLHLNNKEHCLKCRYDNTLKSFIDLANKVHKEKYNYSKVVYKTAKDNIIIICPTHGEFLQTPDNHVHGKGCHSCCVAYIGKNELEYFTPYLKNIMMVDIKHQFKVAKDENSYYAVDFYIPSINLVIEYDEKHHFYKKQQDKIRQEYITKALNCSFIRIDDQKFMKNNEYAKKIIYNYLKKHIDKLKNSI
jgi:very-short-patch-repair endonuclease